MIIVIRACLRHALRSSVALTFILPVTALADAPESISAETQVSVNSPRHPGVMPYRKAYELLDGLKTATKGPLDIVVRVTPKDNLVAQNEIKVWLVGPNIDQPIPISADGIIQIPLDREAYNDNAELVSNQKKGALQIDIKMLPRFNETPIRYQNVLDMIKFAREARDQLLPWYLRLLLPTISSIDFCSPSPAGTVTVTTEDRTSQRPADRVEKNDRANLHCVRFGRQEPGLGPAGLLAPATGMVAQFGG